VRSDELRKKDWSEAKKIGKLLGLAENSSSFIHKHDSAQYNNTT